jgi:hypothetical protein
MESPKTLEQHAADAKTPDWLLASAKAYHGWHAGQEISRAEYDAAVAEAAECRTVSQQASPPSGSES